MGIYSTMDITREDALELINKAVAELANASNKEIADAAFELVGRKMGYNFSIVEDTTNSYIKYR